jgi:hypothetical protein
VRAVVKDGDDVTGRSFLDSDWRYNDDGARRSRGAAAPLHPGPAGDGEWHMATVTSRPDGGDGFVLYVDGKEAASSPPPRGAVAPGETVLTDGGGPLRLEGAAVYLCGRADGASDRFFSGRVSHAAIWDAALTGPQVAELYASVPGVGSSAAAAAAASPAPAAAALAPAPATPFAAPPVVLTVAGAPCAFPFAYGGALHYECVPSAVDPDASFCQDVGGRLSRCSSALTSQYGATRSFLDSHVGTPGGALVADEEGRARLCARGPAAAAAASAAPSTSPLARGAAPCPAPAVCARLTQAQVTRLGPFASDLYRDHFAVGGMGVCATPAGVAWPADADPGADALPLPAAYFPLSNHTTASWPVPEYGLRNLTLTNKTAWVDDALFGSALECGAAAPDAAALLAGVPLGAGGPFAINLWFRQYAAPGDKFQYLFSARPSGVPTAPLDDPAYFEPSQVHVFLPSHDHPARGLVRAIAKDSTDRFVGRPTRTWLDSDGAIGSNAPRPAARAGALTDGEWHMVTLTTHPEGGKGYELYVDGSRRGSTADPLDYFHLDGGAPVAQAMDIVLCGRSDAAASRFFDGRVSQLALFDSPLTPPAVAALYRAGSGGREPMRGASSAAAGGAAAATAAAAAGARAADALAAGAATAGPVRLPAAAPAADAGAAAWPTGPVPKPAVASAAVQRGAVGAAPAQRRRTVSVGAAFALAALAAVLAAAVGVGAALTCGRRRRHWRKEALEEGPASPAAPGEPGFEMGKGKGKAEAGFGAGDRRVVNLSVTAA